MSKQAELEQAKAQLAELMAKVVRLQGEVKREVLIGLPRRIEGASVFIWQDGSLSNCNASQCEFSFGNAFHTESQASAFSQALSVLLRIRRCEGIVGADRHHGFWILVDVSVKKSVEIRGGSSSRVLSTFMFPAFDTREHAERAVEEIGEENIIKCAKTLAFAGEGK